MAGNLNLGAIFYASLRSQFEAAHSQCHRHALCNNLIVAVDGDTILAVYSVVAFKLVSNGRFNALDQMSTLGVEFKVRLGQFVGLPLAAVHETALAVEHILKFVVVAVHFVVHGKHTTEHRLVAPVEHVTSVCAHLVVAGQQRGLKLKLAVAAAILVELVFFSLDNVTFGRAKFNVEYFTYGLFIVGNAAGCVGLEPHCLAQIVCSIVKMEVHSLLREQLVDHNCTHGKSVQWRLGTQRCKGEEQ